MSGPESAERNGRARPPAHATVPRAEPARHLCSLWRTEFHVRRPLEHLARPRWVAMEEATGPAYRGGGHWRRGVRHCIFKLTLSGAGWFADRSGEYAVPEQHGFLCRLDDPSIRYGYPEGASEPWRFVFLAFYTAPELVDELLARHGPIYPLPPDAPVVEALLACERHPAEPMELAAGEAAALVHGLLQAFADAHTHAAADTAAAQLVRAARRAIREAPNAALNVSELAAGLGVSPEHLGRVFRRETGATPLRTILRRRMRLAAEWLVDDGLSVKETAARLGYDTPSHFARAFRRVTGVAPRDYRRNPGLGVW